MEGMILDYHILFLTMMFIMFIISIFLLFIDTTLEKAVAANILLILNFILCIIISLGFGSIDMISYDSDGVIVHNTADMYPFVFVFWVFGYINIMLIFYCVYIYYRKPWEQVVSGTYENEKQYWDTG